MLENKQRIKTIDFARGISVLFIVMVHVMLIYGDLTTQKETITGQIILWLGRGTALFLVVMGISFIQSTKQRFFDVIKRGIYLLGVGYLLNIAKFLIPEFFFGGLPDAYLNAYGLKSQSIEAVLFFLGLGDILQLAGLSLLILAVINQFIKNKWYYLIIALSIVVVSKELSGFRVGVFGLDYCLDLFFSDKYNVYFPVFPWSAFILTGVFLGKKLKESDSSEEFFFNEIAKIGVLLFLIGLGLIFINKKYHFGDYYHLGPGGTITLLGIMIICLWISNRILKFINPNSKLFLGISYLSKNITKLYVIQWILINWGMFLFGFWGCNEKEILLLIPFIFLLTIGVNELFIKISSFLKAKLHTARELSVG